MTPEFTKFIEDGTLPTSMSARSKILDLARRQILSLTLPQNTMTLFRQNPETGVREAVNVPNSSGTTILKGAKLIEAENRIAELEAQIATAPAFENATDLATKGKQLLIAAKVREREAAAKAAALPVVHRAALAAQSLTAESLAVEIVKAQQLAAAAPKPATGLARVTLAFERNAAAKAATQSKAKPSIRPGITGLAKVVACFKADSNFKKTSN